MGGYKEVEPFIIINVALRLDFNIYINVAIFTIERGTHFTSNPSLLHYNRFIHIDVLQYYLIVKVSYQITEGAVSMAGRSATGSNGPEYPSQSFPSDQNVSYLIAIYQDGHTA